MDDPARASLRALSQAIRDRRLSCRELMEAVLARIAQCNPRHNAIVSPRPDDELLAEADRHDALLAEGRWLGVLHGIPQAIKDLAMTRGLRTTLGSRILKDNVPAGDSLFVERMRAAGAILIGKTNTPEFGLGSQTYNDVHGITRNAHDASLTAGGSSGGAAVAIALGMLPVADGSDMMGSLRNPAAFNRVVGLRPSRGRVPVWPAIDQFFAQLGTAGPMARDARDCALLLSVQAGYDARDPLSLDGDGEAFSRFGLAADTAEPAGGGPAAPAPRVAWLGDLDGHLATADGVLERCAAALRRLESVGCRIEAPGAGVLGVAPEALWECWTTLRSVVAAPPLFAWYRDQASRELMKPEAVWEVKRALALSASEVARASQLRTAFYQAWVKLFEQFDFVVLPSAQVFPFEAERHWPQEVGGRRMDTYHRWMEVVIYATLTGSPAISVPVPRQQAGAGVDPVRDLMGVQIIGAPRDDLGVLALAARYEAAGS
ncbi:MAG: amidase [Burkholderiaceae bacterium]|nr:amidase [Burkholderiaceae bacterium]